MRLPLNPSVVDAMPPGSPFDSFLRTVFPNIRVDAFTDVAHGVQGAITHFLSHTHSDHLVGLQAKSFGSIIYCSVDAKEMLLLHEDFKSRDNHDNGLRPEKTQTYKHLRVPSVIGPSGEVTYDNSRDLLVSDLTEPEL